MKILLIAKHPRTGGAAIASSRLMEALREKDVDVNMLVQEGGNEDLGIYSTTHSLLKKWINLYRFILERLAFLPREASSSIRFLFSPATKSSTVSLSYTWSPEFKNHT